MILTEQIIDDAASEVNEAMLAGLPEPGACDVEFSAWFHRKMKRVLHRGNHPVAYRVMQRAASVVLVLLICFAAVMAVSPTVRASVFGWLRERYESSFMYYYFVDDVHTVEGPTRYHIGSLPAEYTEVVSSFDEELGVFLGVYTDDEGDMIHFMYSLKPENSDYYLKAEGYEIEQVYVSGNLGDFYLAKDPSDSNAIIWCDSETNAVFCITAKMEKEELIALAESVQPKEEEIASEEPVDYCLTELPEGYVEYTRSNVPDSQAIIYANSDVKYLYFYYSTNPDAVKMFVKAEGYVVKEATVNDMRADVYTAVDPEESNCIIWGNDDTKTVFYLAGFFDRDELIALAESVEPIK